MGYRLDSNHQGETNQVVFRQTLAMPVFMAVVLIAVGCLMTLISGYAILQGSNIWAELHGWQLTILSMGITFTALGCYLPFHQRGYHPEQMVFDNRTGAFRIVQASEATSYIPYDNIEKFDIRITSSSSSSGKGSSRRVYHYHVHLVQKDGSVWELLETQSSSHADEVLAHLQQHVDLHRPCTVSVPGKFPDKLFEEHEEGKTSFEWKNPLQSGTFLFILVASMIGTGFWQMMGKELFAGGFLPGGGLFNIVPMFIGGVFLLIVSIATFYILRDLLTIYRVEIGRNSFSWIQKNLTGSVRKAETFNLSDVTRVSFDFMLNGTDQPVVVYLKGGRRIELRIAVLNLLERLQFKYWLGEKFESLKVREFES